MPTPTRAAERLAASDVVRFTVLAPIGLPHSPERLDREHTWATGLPIRFGVLYAGDLGARWLRRRRTAGAAACELVA